MHIMLIFSQLGTVNATFFPVKCREQHFVLFKRRQHRFLPDECG